MERLQLISQLDPDWYMMIEKFLIQNPEFGAYAYLVPMHKPIHNQKLKPKYFIDHLLLYICEAGVNRNYAHKQFDLIRNFLQQNNYHLGLMVELLGENIQPKKRQIYIDLWKHIEPIGALNFTLEHLLQHKIKGIGVGCIGQLKQFWSTDPNAIEISDRGFIAGFAKVYHINKKPTPKQITEKVEGWGENKIIGSLICTQIYHYLLSNQ
jgi:hypothetical protein